MLVSARARATRSSPRFEICVFVAALNKPLEPAAGWNRCSCTRRGSAARRYAATAPGCTLYPVKVRELIAVIQADEWSEVRTKGSHRQFRHPTKPGTVTVAGSPASMCRSVGSVHPQDAESPLPIPADLREQVEHAERMGFDLYIFDKAAWIATDGLQEHVGNLQNAGI